MYSFSSFNIYSGKPPVSLNWFLLFIDYLQYDDAVCVGINLIISAHTRPLLDIGTYLSPNVLRTDRSCAARIEGIHATFTKSSFLVWEGKVGAARTATFCARAPLEAGPFLPQRHRSRRIAPYPLPIEKRNSLDCVCDLLVPTIYLLMIFFCTNSIGANLPV